MSMKHPDQRIGIFIDVQNLYYSAKALYGSKVNFGEIINTATAGRKLVRAIAYTIKAEMPEEQSFFDALEKLGIEVKTKELQTFVNGAKKGDWDVGIAVDIIKMAPKLDSVILCSGDGDFQLLLHHAKAEGCRAEVLSFGKSTSAKLIEEADDFTDLDAESSKYLLKPMNRTNTRPNPRPIATNEPNSNTVATSNENSSAPKAVQAKISSPKNLEEQIIAEVNKDQEPPKKKRGFFR